jgi:hypothetical protein
MKIAKRNSSTARQTKKKAPDVQYVVCLRNEGYAASLERHKIYRILVDEEAERMGDLRVIDESGEDYLYPADWFTAIRVPQKVEASLAKSA